MKPISPPKTLATDKMEPIADLRCCLECFAVRQLTGRAGDTKELSGKLHALLEDLRKHARLVDYRSFMEMDRRIHETLIRSAGVPTLLESWRAAWNALARFQQESIREHWPNLRSLLAEHEYLVRAVCSGDPVAAEDGIRHHLEAVWYRIPEKRTHSSARDAPLQRAISYLALHYHRPIRLTDVAADIAYASAGHLSHLFRLHYGMGFQAYLVKLRLDKAAELLRATKLPAAVIARRVGYTDIPRFGRHFKRAFGDSPCRWRRARDRGENETN